MMQIEILKRIKKESKCFMTKFFLKKHLMLVKMFCFIILDSTYFLES